MITVPLDLKNMDYYLGTDPSINAFSWGRSSFKTWGNYFIVKGSTGTVERARRMLSEKGDGARQREKENKHPVLWDVITITFVKRFYFRR